MLLFVIHFFKIIIIIIIIIGCILLLIISVCLYWFRWWIRSFGRKCLNLSVLQIIPAQPQ